jgi:hypothetical protein
MTKQVTISNKLKPNFDNEYKENFVVENLFSNWLCITQVTYILQGVINLY